jgi:hypothetical protein
MRQLSSSAAEVVGMMTRLLAFGGIAKNTG